MLQPAKFTLLVFGLGLLSGCGGPKLDAARQAVYALGTGTDQYVANSFRDVAFEEGRVAVVAEMDGKLRTFWLVPCGDGTRICAGGPNGRAVPFSRTLDFTIVSGAYRGRDFYLSPGGDGLIIAPDGQHPLAWE